MYFDWLKAVPSDWDSLFRNELIRRCHLLKFHMYGSRIIKRKNMPNIWHYPLKNLSLHLNVCLLSRTGLI